MCPVCAATVLLLAGSMTTTSGLIFFGVKVICMKKAPIPAQLTNHSGFAKEEDQNG